MKYQEPQLAKLLLKIFLRNDLRQHRLDEYDEIFYSILNESGYKSAAMWYWGHTLKSLPNLINNSFYWGTAMFKNYLTTAFRTIKKNKTFSFINITGIAVSLAACFLILQYVSFEMSYDQQHINKDNLYRLTNDRYQDGELKQHGVITYPSVAKTMEADYPEVVNYTRLLTYSPGTLTYNNTKLGHSVLLADSAFFKMFSFSLIEGDVSSVLGQPYSVAVSQSTAEKYFGANWKSQNIIGTSFTLDDEFDVTLKGVFEDIPENSHMEFDIVVSYLTLRNQYGAHFDDSWTNSNFMSYLQLTPGTDSKILEQKFADFTSKYFKGDEVTGYREEFFLQPLTDIHLNSDYEYEAWVHGSGTTVTALIIIAAFILIITWVNYINISTAKSMERAKEVGMRKVVGAHRSQIIKQFMTESLLYNLFGLLIAAVLVYLAAPFFSSLLDVSFTSEMLMNIVGLGFLLLLIFGTLFTGLYPALVTSSFKTISVLKGKIANTGKGVLLRKGLVVFQFALSFTLIAGTYIVYEQINFMMDQDLGMNIEQTIVLAGPDNVSFDSTYIDKVNSFKSELRTYHEITHAATSRRLPGRISGRLFNVSKLMGNSDKKYTTSDIGIDFDYFDTFGMKIIAGRGFDLADHNSEFNALSSVVINEATVKLMEFGKPEDAINQKINFWGQDWEIIGVVNDHHQQSLHVAVEPTIFTPQYSTGSYLFAKVNTGNLPVTIATIESSYNAFFPGSTFDYFFMDEYFNRQYNGDRDFRNAFALFSSLGILLSCMGLFGLSFFITAQRTKEIGVRKVAGATTQNILMLLLKDFGKLIAAASIVASPIAYIIIANWLNGYAYRIEFGFTMMIVPALMVFAVAIITVSFQSIKAAIANPIDSIKYE